MTSSLKLIAAAVVASAGLVFAAPALAESPAQISLQIQYDNSALASSPGAQTVLESLREQAKDACRYDAPISNAPRVDRDCAEEAVARAVAHIDHPQLTAAYLGTTANGTRLLASLD